MNTISRTSRRLFLKRSGATGLGLVCFAGVPLASAWLHAAEAPASGTDWVRRIADPDIRAGVETAAYRNLIPAATERVYPGHFTINADGGGFGSDTTWPGLDSWQMIGPYLQLGRRRMVQDYFDFVRASQRKDGNIPFAVFSGNTRPGGCLRGLKYEKWESSRSADCSVEPFNDVAAMGRVWYLEAMACQRIKAHDRLVDSVRKVCRAGKATGYWRERYHLKPDGSVPADGSQKYCEYAAVLARVVFANRAVFYP